MAIEAIDWGDVPEARNGDDTTTYVMGAAFTVTEAVPCPGIEWEVPDSLTPEPASADGKIWASLWEGTTRVKNIDITALAVAGTKQRFLFDAPYTCVVEPEYTVQVLTRTYTYRTGGGFPYSTPSGIGVASEGRLSASTDPTTRAGGSSSARFYVSPLLGEESGAEAVTATLDALLPALDAEISGEATVAATLAVTLPALDSALSVDVAGEVADQDMTLRAVMREIAAVLRSVTPRFAQVHDAPPGSITAPAAVVTYPQSWDTQLTYGPNAVVKYEQLSVWVLAAGVNGKYKSALTDMSAWAKAVPDALDGHTWVSCDVVTLTGADTGVVTIANVDYLGIAFYLDAWGYGS